MEEDRVYFGEVCWFSNMKGYGFLTWSIDGVSQPDIFAHFSDIACEGFKSLTKEQKVSFSIGLNRHGDKKAVNIQVIG